jgi:ribosomal protein S1
MMVLKVLFTFQKFLGLTNKGPIKGHNVGEKIEAQVLEVDVENKRISLGIKQLQPNPWDESKLNTL